MSDMKHLRKKLMVNREVQGAIICKTILHWFFYLAAILLTVVICKVWADPSRLAIRLVYSSFVYFAPAVIASAILLPVMICDTLKETHRVAGPIHRLGNEMNRIAEGHEFRKLRFRDGDHWYDLAEVFNNLASKHDDQRREIERLKLELGEAQQEPVC